MSLASDTKNSEGFIKSAYLAAEEMGAEMPEQKNLANLSTTIATIPTGPSLPVLKKTLDKGTAPSEFPVGTEIEDTYAGNPNPLIVAQYLDSTNNSAYKGAVGVILIRKFVEPVSQVFGSGVNYPTSTIKNFLDTTYLGNCSAELKAVISPISIRYSGAVTSVWVDNNNWFLMSGIETGGTSQPGEGIFWDYWKQKTGLTSPTDGSRAGRIVRDRTGTARYAWLRSRYRVDGGVYEIFLNGALDAGVPQSSDGVLPACFIAKGGNV